MHVFLGDFNRDDPISWNSASNKVGSVNVLGDSLDTGCEKCQEDQANALTVTGQVPLTLALAERYLAGLLDNLSVEAVIPYLQKNLHWRVSLVGFLPHLLGFTPFNSLIPSFRTMAPNSLVAKCHPSSSQSSATKLRFQRRMMNCRNTLTSTPSTQTARPRVMVHRAEKAQV